MSIEIKQHLKLSQQLVMTPQLQQAIKLLQLSRMELVDMVREEMLENPILEDAVESGNEQAKGTEAVAPAEAASNDAERVGETETPMAEIPTDKVDSTAEVKADTRPTRRSPTSTGRPTSTTRPRRRPCRPTSRTTRTCRRWSRR